MGFLEGLTLLLIGLKLADVIDWSWLWVLSPLVLCAAPALIGVMIEFLTRSKSED